MNGDGGALSRLPNGSLYAPALPEIIRLLELVAGDPSTVDKAIAYEQSTVTDADVVGIERVADGSEGWSILMIQFAASSGAGRYLTTGGFPSAAGFGMPIPAGGTIIIIRGVDNIVNFKMIAETGQTMISNALLFKAQAWRGIAR